MAACCGDPSSTGVYPAIKAATLAALVPAERLQALRSTLLGLDPAEAARRLAREGPNEPVVAAGRRWLLAFSENFTHTLALLLWFAAGLAFAAGIAELGAAIVAVVLLNGLFAFAQEYQAERLVAGLMHHVTVRALVHREGRDLPLPARELVRGDIVRLVAGDIVPADCVLLEADNLALDLSEVTGETLPVAREADAVAPPAAHVHIQDLPSICPGGAAVMTGSGIAAVFATGPESTIGQVAAMVEGVRPRESRLQREVSALSHVTAVVAVVAGAAILTAANLATEMSFTAALIFSTGVIVALVPEGLLPTLSVSLAIGAGRMARRGAAVRRLAAVEVVGSVTVICTDKTGTLTLNRLTVAGFVDAEGSTEPHPEALLAAALCNDAVPGDVGEYRGDPIDSALAAWCDRYGYESARLREYYPRRASVPFSARHRYMSVTCEVQGQQRVFLKGAPETVLRLARMSQGPPALLSVLEEATQRGERVLLLAVGADGEPPHVAGLVRFEDPPRPEVGAAVAACQRAGIRVIMLTGDHPATAQAVARTIGLGAGALPVVEGSRLAEMSDAALLSLLRTDAVFARIDPAEKLRIVTLLRREGEVVVVTGDGTNDAPALRAADVGVAMGLRGTEVAKHAADVVLADDNFATIVAAIEEGRSIKTNIRRFVSYVFTSNMAEVAPFVSYVFLPIPLPLAVIQALAIDIGTDLLPALALGAEAPSERAMDAAPEPRRRQLLAREVALRTFLFFGIIEAALGLAGFMAYYLWDGWRPFESMPSDAAFVREAATVTFLSIVGGQIGCLFAQRDGSLARRLSLRENRWIGWGLAFEVMLALALVYVPGLNRLFAMSAIHPAWLLVTPAAATLFLALDVVRRALRVQR